MQPRPWLERTAMRIPAKTMSLPGAAWPGTASGTSRISSREASDGGTWRTSCGSGYGMSNADRQGALRADPFEASREEHASRKPLDHRDLNLSTDDLLEHLPLRRPGLHTAAPDEDMADALATEQVERAIVGRLLIRAGRHRVGQTEHTRDQAWPVRADRQKAEWSRKLFLT